MNIKKTNISTRILKLALLGIFLSALPVSANEVFKTKASSGLITLATTGNPFPLRGELGGKVISSAKLQEKSGKVLDLAQKEHLAPKALVLADGSMYAMVAPTITKDNFIYVGTEGKLMRMDVGETEGHRMPFVVREIVEDGGASIWAQIGHWFNNLFVR